MTFKVSILLSIFMLKYFSTTLVSSCDIQKSYPISLIVYNAYVKPVNVTYNTDIAFRGILLGAMRKIQADPSTNFTFTITEDPNYGPFLVSVNGMAGNPDDHTYWEILAELQNGTTIRTDVGVGCYIPNPNDAVILKFTTWQFEEKLYTEHNTCRKFT